MYLFIFKNIHLLIWLPWVLVVVGRIVVAVGGLLQWQAGCRGHRLSCGAPTSCPAACGLFTEKRLKPSPLHWQVNSCPRDHLGSPVPTFKVEMVIVNASQVVGTRAKHRVHESISHSVMSHSLDCMHGTAWSPPGSSVVGIFQASMLEWVAVP